MQQLRLQVVNEVGLHARTASVFVSEASRFSSHIRIRNATSDSQWVDAKSMLLILTLGVEKDHEVEVTAEGPDEAEAAAALEHLIVSDFAGKL